MIGYAIRRLLLAIPTLLAMLTLVFVLVRLVPGDAAVAMLGDRASDAALQALRIQLGLDQPIAVQYLHFMSDMLTGNFGRSMVSGRTVLEEVALVLPYTLELAAAAMLVGTLLGVPLGVIAAVRRDQWLDYLSRILSLVGLSFPGFVSAILMLLAFAVWLQWLPVMSRATSDPVDHFLNLLLPALNLGLIMTAYLARVTRSSMLDVMGEDYIRTARAKGVHSRSLILRHALGNALIPIVTVVGLYFGTLIGNSVLTEIVFTRPGLGKLILGALQSRDYTMLQGLMVVFATFVIIVNTTTDLIYALVDPRVSLAR
ncbi:MULTISPECIES: ABC transporter permease [unclassified Chelatococcus]|jgi:glutathione transport system permease protein|uniref:ABC transporter permease n=1 Tax=unclassified Chelatococcus TaxID=2638111 RepID=UPI001BCD51C7|nr:MULTISPECIES: ABC transporter permease [unclassified Chelatococcus]CAH1650999.1 glutathione ABC transporter membrane subunit GsiC [Hyphomicrobiales bacterium]MBS7739798.1 ABC transporter permease [Chelatococcus sp. HY11]MBX3545442.1 ABC transporter permease [Chelatococcus sp.]MCO5078903.1 ABC transporter permease [Chelatococcus sp.]CAH1686400.1 glutathione ABC transporter membrane subunit GsiC [Hyphomicrobiales bacterium]